ncbi:MAG: hypothetical protein ABL933_15695 [Methyloglobulus sp.]
MGFVDEKAEEEKASKQAKWQEIQDRAPDLAKFLSMLNAAFGKVKLIGVEFKRQ